MQLAAAARSDTTDTEAERRRSALVVTTLPVKLGTVTAVCRKSGIFADFDGNAGKRRLC
jgi:hypothetical protein